MYPHNTAPTPGVTDRPGMLGMAYRYDQLNRLVDAVGHSASYIAAPGNAAEFNRWQVSETQAHLYRNSFTYDPNSNIETQKRWDEMGVLFEDLEYQYNWLDDELIQNRLYHVNDLIAGSTQEGDIEDQGTFFLTDGTHHINQDNNFGYTSLGELKRDVLGGIEEVTWSAAGKILEIIRSSNHSGKSIRFDYDGAGIKVAKHIYSDSGLSSWESSEYYVTDNEGNVMAVYLHDAPALSPSSLSFRLSERHIYGNERLGVNVHSYEFISASTSDESESRRELGKKYYEIPNHLGNVLAVITDQRIPVIEQGSVVSYSAVVVTARDYSPFGASLYGRNWSGNYTYGFNTQRSEYEVYESESTYHAEFWMYDTRLGRRWNIDPVTNEHLSPYACLENSPIQLNDPHGDCPDCPDGTYEIKSGDNFWKLEEEWGMEHGTLQEFNPNLEPKNLQVGQKILTEPDIPVNAPFQVDTGMRWLTEAEMRPMEVSVAAPLIRGAGLLWEFGTSLLATGTLARSLDVSTTSDAVGATIKKPATFYYVTYTKTNVNTGHVYVGRASGYGTPDDVVERRDMNHHMTIADGWGAAKLSTSLPAVNQTGFTFRYDDPSYWAIRGSEQLQIEHYRKLGISGNRINGISPNNRRIGRYLQYARDLLGH